MQELMQARKSGFIISYDVGEEAPLRKSTQVLLTVFENRKLTEVR